MIRAPSLVRWTSSSMAGTFRSHASRNAARVFSGASADSPLWATSSTPGPAARMAIISAIVVVIVELLRRLAIWRDHGEVHQPGAPSATGPRHGTSAGLFLSRGRILVPIVEDRGEHSPVGLVQPDA